MSQDELKFDLVALDVGMDIMSSLVFVFPSWIYTLLTKSVCLCFRGDIRGTE